MTFRSNRELPDALRHDGTPTGCLCAIDEALQFTDVEMSSFLGPHDTPPLFAQGLRSIPADPERANRLLARLRAAAGEPAVAIVLNALIAMPPEIESSLLRFIRGALRHGSGWIGARADPDVATVRQWSRRVRLEIHRFKGLLRFAELASGRWLATCEPDFDIVMPLAFHFRRRLGGQRWLIFDIRRQTAASWNGRQINAETADNRPLQAGEIQAWLGDDSLSADEARCRNLWQVFHQRVSIESRANPRLQRRAMPARYWRHLTEMEPPTT